VLAELARAHLVTEHAPGRFTFHDLRRVLDHYLHSAQAAAIVLAPVIVPVSPPPAHPSVVPERFDRYEAAAAWFEVEYPVLLKTRAGDRLGQAYAHRSLGRAYRWFGRFDDAHTPPRQT
jgi:hypothetical protein